MIFTSIVLLSYVLYITPQTGLVLSTGRGGLSLSKGYTTLYNPPKDYVNDLLESSKIITRAKVSPSISATSKKKKKINLNEHDDDSDTSEEGTVVYHKLNRKSDLIQAITSQVSISADRFLPEKEEEDADDEGEGEDDENMKALEEEILHLLYDTGTSILSSRRLSEFVDSIETSGASNNIYESSSLSLRLQSNDYDDKRKYAFLVSKRLGDYGRYGLQPLKLHSFKEEDDDNICSLTYSTLAGGHFDGRLMFNIIKHEAEGDGNDDESTKSYITIQTKLCIPKNGCSVKSKKLAKTIIYLLTQSIKKSLLTDVQKVLIRKKQSSTYYSQAKKRAKEKRHLRYINELKQEEMARDRKRKWQRQNPDATRYTPSGHRLKSPNNC